MALVARTTWPQSSVAEPLAEAHNDLLCFKREGGGWPRLNRLFGGELDGVLQQFQREVWAA